MATALVVLIGVGALWAALRALERARRLVPDVAALHTALSSGEGSAIRSALATVFAGADADVIAAAVLGESPAAAAILSIDEHLGDIDRALRAGAALARTLPRLAFGAGLFGAVVELSFRRSEGGAAWVHPVEAFLSGAVFAAASFEAARRVSKTEDRARAVWDEVGRLVGSRLGAQRSGRATERSPWRR